jgi:hypothetical protein
MDFNDHEWDYSESAPWTIILSDRSYCVNGTAAAAVKQAYQDRALSVTIRTLDSSEQIAIPVQDVMGFFSHRPQIGAEPPALAPAGELISLDERRLARAVNGIGMQL